ncbi:Bacterial mobilization protein (MobC) [Hoeflea sp. IMCC20628]|nr:Bacterial mobilization protein (MobC) [Hoeflea sp. IMCC20628]
MLTKLLGQLAKIGSNLNQITRAVNAHRLTGHSEELSFTLGEIDRLRMQVRELLE